MKMENKTIDAKSSGSLSAGSVTTKRKRQSMIPKKMIPPLVGAFAGAISEVGVLPIMSIKTRLMVQNVSKNAQDVAKYSGLMDGVRQMYKEGGYRVFFKGGTSMLTFSPVGRGLYMLTVDYVQKKLGRGPVKDFTAGMCGQLVGSLGFLPRDIITERCQIEGQVKVNATYSGSWNALRSIWKTEGMRGFYRAYWPHQMAWVPFNGSYWAIYGQLKGLTSDWEQTNTLRLGNTFMAGAIAAFITAPVDLIKTRMQVRGANPEIFCFDTVPGCIRYVYENEGGFRGFFAGAQGRVLWLGNRMMLFVTLYENIAAHLES